MSVQLKPCTPEDVNEAVPLIYSSGPDAFEFVFKNEKHTAQDFLRYAFTRKGGEFSFANHYALWKDGEIVGVGSVFKHRKASNFIFTDALNIIRFYGLQFSSIAFNGLRVEGIIKLPTKGEITIGHLGIKAECRGIGLGTQMIHLLMVEAKATEKEVFVLDVSEENPRAISLYENLGFKKLDRNISNLKNKYSYVPNHWRMKLL